MNEETDLDAAVFGQQWHSALHASGASDDGLAVQVSTASGLLPVLSVSYDDSTRTIVIETER